MRPSPRPRAHDFVTRLPEPLHDGHEATLTNCPNIDRLTCRTSPAPPHCEQSRMSADDSAPRPAHAGHVTMCRIEIVFSTPVAISSSVSGRRIFRSLPDCLPNDGPLERPLPKMSPKIEPPKAEKTSLISPNPWKSWPARMPW